MAIIPPFQMWYVLVVGLNILVSVLSFVIFQIFPAAYTLHFDNSPKFSPNAFPLTEGVHIISSDATQQPC